MLNGGRGLIIMRSKRVKRGCGWWTLERESWKVLQAVAITFGGEAKQEDIEAKLNTLNSQHPGHQAR